jgi:large conductance mechanosensitive channel
LVVLPYNTLRKRGEVKQAEDTELSLLTQIRDQLAESNGGSPGHHSANAPESATVEDR